jgi:hypothetical protein
VPSISRARFVPMVPWLKTILFRVIALVVVLIFCIGFVVATDMIWRSVYSTQRSGRGVDVSVFHYQDYVVSTHPVVTLGHKKQFLDDYFADRSCAEPDGTMARFNSLGFRSPEFVALPAKQPNEVRIIVTGGSVSISWNVSEACTLDANLRRLLAARFPGKSIKIFNLGNGAWKSLQELIAIQRFGLDIKPDLIIAFNGFNDIEHSHTSAIGAPYAGWRMREAFNRYADWTLGGPLASFQGLRIVSDLRDLLSTWSFARFFSARASDRYPELAAQPLPGMLATRVELPIDPQRIAQRTDFDPHNRQTVDFYLRNMMLMGLAAKASGSRMLYVLQPALYLKDPMSQAEADLIPKYYEGEVNYVVQGYGRIAAGLQELVDKGQFGRFLDLSAPFQGDGRRYFGDYAHISSDGYRIVAARIADVVAEVLEEGR